MSDKDLIRIAEIVAEKTSRRDFLGWLGRMAAGLVGALSLMSLGATRAYCSDTCSSADHWEMLADAIEVCACDAGEAIAAVMAEMSDKCSSYPFVDQCQLESCRGDTEEDKHCYPVLIASSANIGTRAPTQDDVCPNNCATGTSPVVAYGTGSISCKCACKPPASSAPTTRCDTAPHWTIHRRIIAPEAGSKAEAEKLIKAKAATECRNSPAASAYCEQGHKCSPKRKCVTIGVASIQGSYPNQKMDGAIDCQCWCAPE